MKYTYAISALSLLLLLGAQGAYAQTTGGWGNSVNPQLTVNTDNAIYSAGSVVHLSGVYTGKTVGFFCLSVNVYANGNLVGFGSIPRASCSGGKYTGVVTLPSALAASKVLITVRGGSMAATTSVNIGQKASGTFPPTTVIGLTFTSATTFNIISEGPITGSLSGTYVSNGNVTETATGATYVAIDTCTCSFLGATGVTTFYEVGSVNAAGVLTSTATITSSTFGLTGYLNFNGFADPTTLSNYGTYTGVIAA